MIRCRTVGEQSQGWLATDLSPPIQKRSARSCPCVVSLAVPRHRGNLLLLKQLWFLRLSCLARLRLFNQCTAECTNLYSVLSSIEPSSSRNYVFDRLVPFELEVLHVRLKYWAGDFVGYLDTMYAMVKKCKLMTKIALEEGEREREKQLERERRGSVATGIGGRDIRGPRGDGGAGLAAMWKERGSRMVLIIASQFIEMKVWVPPQSLTASLTVWLLPSPPTRRVRCRSGVYGCHASPHPTLHSILTRTAFSSGKGIPPSRTPRPSPD